MSYADNALDWLAAGFDPLPLPPGAKWPPPKKSTGVAAPRVDEARVRAWIKTNGDGNLALRLPPGVIGLDVDVYGDKHGDETLAALVETYGELPLTWLLTSRDPSTGNGIRLFRVPEDIELPGVLGPGIEVIQRHHRYAVGPGSTHPDSGETYQLWEEFDDALEVVEGPVSTDLLPELPAEWLLVRPVRSRVASSASDKGARTGAGAREDGGGASTSRALDKSVTQASAEDTRAWMAARDGDPCRATAGTLKLERKRLAAAAETGEARYDAARDGVMALVRLGSEGHLGTKAALTELRADYLAALDGEPNRDAAGEWRRMVRGAVAAVSGFEDDAHGPGADDCPDRPGVSSTDKWPSPQAPLDVAERYVALCWTVDGSVTLRRWRGQFYGWTGRHYEPISEESLLSRLGALLKDAEYWGASSSGPAQVLAWKPNPTKIGAVLKMLVSVPGVLVPDEVDASDGDGKVSLRNGVFDLAARTLSEHEPERFNLTAFDFEWLGDDPEAVKVGLKPWLDFLADLWPTSRDGAEVALLAQWFGYVLSGMTSQQKALLLIGPPRSGKGTIARVLTALVGQAFTSSPSLKTWGGTFFLAQLLGKSSAIVTDADAGARAAAEAVEDLKRITGEDVVTVARKYLTDWTGMLGVRFTLFANNMPAFLDTSGALARRFLPLRLTETFVDREDVGLSARLTAPESLAAVFVWALDGLDSLTASGRFVEARSSRELARAMVEDFSPVQSFLNDCCTTRSTPTSVEDFIERKRLYAAYCDWCVDNGRQPTSMIAFGRDLRSVLPKVMGNGNQVYVDGRKMRVFYGVELHDAGTEL